jgi:hypothetical protein
VSGGNPVITNLNLINPDNNPSLDTSLASRLQDPGIVLTGARVHPIGPDDSGGGPSGQQVGPAFDPLDPSTWGPALQRLGQDAADTAGQLLDAAKREARLLPGTLSALPDTIPQTFRNGEAADSLAGAVDGGIDALVSPFGVRPLSRGPLYGNDQAFANGRTVGQGAVLTAGIVVFVSGTMGLGAAALPAIGGGAAVGGGALALAADAGGSAALAGSAVMAGAGLAMAMSTAGTSRARGARQGVHRIKTLPEPTREVKSMAQHHAKPRKACLAPNPQTAKRRWITPYK